MAAEAAAAADFEVVPAAEKAAAATAGFWPEYELGKNEEDDDGAEEETEADEEAATRLPLARVGAGARLMVSSFMLNSGGVGGWGTGDGDEK